MENEFIKKPNELIKLKASTGKKINSTDRDFSPFGNDITESIKWIKLTDITKYFKDQIVVDLGAGIRPAGYSLARTSGAISYIGVEKYNHEKLKEILNYHLKNHKKMKYKWENNNSPIPYAIYPGDMLDFLSRIKKDNSVSIILSWINDAIILGNCSELNSEITRVLNPKGAILSNNSVIGLNLYTRLKEKELSDYISIYRK